MATSNQEVKENLVIENVRMTLYRYGSGAKLEPGKTEALVCDFGDISGVAFATPSVADNKQSANYKLEITKWVMQMDKGKPSLIVDVKNNGTAAVFPAVSVLFAMQN